MSEEQHSQSAQLGDAVQLNPGETLDTDDMTDEPLDSGYIPPDRPSEPTRHGVTAQDQAEGESLDERLVQEEPPVGEDPDPSSDPDRSGRLVGEPDAGRETDSLGQDVGIDGGAASAEEAAVHTQEPPD